MIDRDATITKFGYDPDTLSSGSGKLVIAVCNRCGKIRELEKKWSGNLCRSCAKKKYFEDPKAREKISTLKKKYHKDHPEAGDKHSMGMKKRYENPATRKEQSDAKKRYYKDHPETKEKLSATAKKRWDNPDERKKMSLSKKKHFEDPEKRRKQSAATKKYYEEHPEAGKELSGVMKEYYKNHPKVRDKMITSQKKYWDDPKARQRHSAAIQGIAYEEWEAFAKEQKYCPAFNEACRESNRKKYGRRCFICGKHESDNITKNGKQRKLSVHHVDLNKMQGCDGHRWKLIPTCMEHHGTTHNPMWISRITYLLRNIDYNHH